VKVGKREEKEAVKGGEKERNNENQFHILFMSSKYASIGVYNALK
jgi:hypothetical protein